jgi:3-deoxy-7-phosphoheptulonate synthase
MINAPLVTKAHRAQQTVVRIADRVAVGSKAIAVIAGPCAVESMAQMDSVVRELANAPVQIVRGGVFKPRTSPYAFQGLGEAGLDILREIRHRYDIPVVTEVMAIAQIERIAASVDLVQIGSRNVQNFDLLKAVGQVDCPILLKRGLSAHLEEFLLAAEYIVSHGNPNVILCERGILSFDPYTRNVLDLGTAVALKQLTHLPVIVDPSHATGRRELVAPLARAAIACGADGITVECHSQPERSLSDARQALSLIDTIDLVDSLRPIAAAVGREMVVSSDRSSPTSTELTLTSA